MLRQVSVAITASLGLLLAGCTMNPANDAREEAIQMCKQNLPAAQRIKLESVSMGCMASMAFHKAIGSNNPVPLLCMAGGLSGFLFGESIAERKCTYVSQNDQIQGELAHIKKMNAGFVVVLAQKAQELAASEGMVAALKAGAAGSKAQSAERSSVADSLQKQLLIEKSELDQVRQEFRFKQETLASARALHKQEAADSLLAEIRILEKHVKRLQDNSAKLARLHQSLLV